jgi:hypothetical protein
MGRMLLTSGIKLGGERWESPWAGPAGSTPDQRLSLVLDRVLGSEYQLPRLFSLPRVAFMLAARGPFTQHPVV